MSNHLRGIVVDAEPQFRMEAGLIVSPQQRSARTFIKHSQRARRVIDRLYKLARSRTARQDVCARGTRVDPRLKETHVQNPTHVCAVAPFHPSPVRPDGAGAGAGGGGGATKQSNNR